MTRNQLATPTRTKEISSFTGKEKAHLENQQSLSRNSSSFRDRRTHSDDLYNLNDMFLTIREMKDRKDQ